MTDPSVLKAILRVHDREGVLVTECAACDCGWQVPHDAAASVGDDEAAAARPGRRLVPVTEDMSSANG